MTAHTVNTVAAVLCVLVLLIAGLVIYSDRQHRGWTILGMGSLAVFCLFWIVAVTAAINVALMLG